MRHVWIVFFVAATTLAYGQATEAEQINALHKKKFEWLIENNRDSLNALLAARVSYVHSNGWMQSRQEVLDDMSNGKLKYQSVTVETSEVNLIDNTALVTGKGMFTGVMNGTSFSVKLLYTEVYVKIGEHWKLTGRHACRLP